MYKLKQLRFASHRWYCALSLVLSLILGCNSEKSGVDSSSKTTAKPVIGIAFETLQTEFWVAGYAAIKKECEKRGYDVVESVADGDANRQLQQVKNLITRKVNGIILVPKDAKSCGPMIRVANVAKIPIVLFNRPADFPDLESVAVVADNQSLSEKTTMVLVEQAKALSQPVQAMVLLGDLSDSNAIKRRDGFEAAIQAAKVQGIAIDVVARIPTEWNQEKAQSGVVNALQAHPNIRLIFTSSDFLLPSIVSALKSVKKYHKTGHPEHVILGGFDGDETAYNMLREGYLDATGVQDVYFEAAQSVQAIVNLREGTKGEKLILDPGFVIDQKQLDELKSQMWGAQIAKQ
jgi:ABC-type sugar transport system substrate-binding protein